VTAEKGNQGKKEHVRRIKKRGQSPCRESLLRVSEKKRERGAQGVAWEVGTKKIRSKLVREVRLMGGKSPRGLGWSGRVSWGQATATEDKWLAAEQGLNTVRVGCVTSELTKNMAPNPWSMRKENVEKA